ncbi:hypothetical protein ACKWTF_000491 [Chironomus riparius]
MITFSCIFVGNILQPSAPLSFNSNNNGTSSNDSIAQQRPTVVGSTWSNVNIDLDNLMGKKNMKGPSVSMNQMKSANTSPVKSPLSANVMSPTMNSNFAFNQSNNNNNNFNQFNAFQ